MFFYIYEFIVVFQAVQFTTLFGFLNKKNFDQNRYAFSLRST